MKQKDSNKITFKQAWQNNIYLFKKAYAISRKRVCIDFILKIFWYGFSYFYNIIFIAVVFDSIENKKNFLFIIYFMSGICAITLVEMLLSNWYFNKFRPETDTLLYEKLNLMVFEKAAEVELSCYENADFYNKYTRASQEAGERAVKVLDNLSDFAGALISSLLIFATIIVMDAWSLFFVILPVFTKLFVAVRRNKAKFELDKENTRPNRIKAYVNRIIYLEEFAKEIRLTKIFKVLMKNYDGALREAEGNIKRTGKKIAKYRALDDVFARVFRYPACIIYSAARVLIFGSLKASQFIVLMNAIGNYIHSVEKFSNVFTSVQEDGIYIKNLREFLEYKPLIPESQDGFIPEKSGNTLVLKNVSYKYEGSEDEILSDINIEIKPNEKIALVGHNGAGKTTLIKLIMRLYDATGGEICLNEKNIRDYNVKLYRNLYGTVFQDYRVMSLSAAENVLMDKVENEDYEKVEDALKMSGVYDKIVENGGDLDTTLTREFDEKGLVLSGGEFQKIAIARVFANDCQFAVLDEPSSALDPIAEYKMFENLMIACKNKTVIFISHRLSSAVLADRIYMLEKGRIVEKGSHTELMEINGKYAEMFSRQAENYSEESELA